MADPVTLSIMAGVSIASTAAGAAVSAAGAETKGKAAQDMYNYQAGVAQVNKQIADNNATYALGTGESKAQIAGLKTSSTIGSEKAGQGAGGLDVNSGSNAEIRASTADLGAYDQGVIRNQAAREAYGYQVQGWQDTQQANLDVMAGKNARTAADIDATSSIIGGVSSVASKWSSFKSQGVM